MIRSLMISPPLSSRFARIRSGSTRTPSNSSSIRARMSPVSSQAGCSERSIIALVEPSASCSVRIASSASGSSAVTCAVAARMSCDSLGLRFCGIVLLPTVPGGTGSSSSPNSGFISAYVSSAILRQVPASIAKIAQYSAW